jgi:hypothetical protein
VPSRSGAGAATNVAAWLLNWAALPLGMGRSPRRLFAAFVRGRRTGNLYGTDLDVVLDLPVSVVQASLGLDRPHRGNPGDLVLFIGVVMVAPVAGAVPALVSLLTCPVWIVRGAALRWRG